MPRPGSRPYECVRRAWHSDRHQPMRGSLIQEIFRVVNEIHGSATKKNKEWQDKLPVVVLKAEEIMYSKANSEAEYMDLETLWDRANDAINTIIRLDESTETGVSLQPCIEAALILGCTPRRATRSQRNSTPSYYLNVAGAEPTCHPSSNLHKGTLGTQNTISPFILDYSKIFTANNMTENNPTRDEWPLFCPRTMTPSIYPLYYGLESQSNDSKIGVENPFKSDCCKEGPAEMGVIQDISSCCTDARDKIKKADLRSTCENSPATGCDLSLRLGPCMHPLSSIKNRRPQEVKGFGSPNSQGSKLRNLDPQLNKFFSSLQSNAAGINSSNASTSNCGSKSEKLNLDATVKKRKGVANHLYEDRQNSWQAKLPFDHHVGRLRSAGATSNENASRHNRLTKDAECYCSVQSNCLNIVMSCRSSIRRMNQLPARRYHWVM